MAVTMTHSEIEILENKRLTLQRRLDSTKTQHERNKLGQFATPSALAIEILEYAQQHFAKTQPIRFLDPAFGTGAFYAALLQTFAPSRNTQKAWGYELDPLYGEAARKLWRETYLDLKIEDFTQATPPTLTSDRANLLICNPPYVRHHHLSNHEKRRLQTAGKQSTGIKMNGLAGLYCYFLLLCHAWMADDGLAGWLIPSEFMDVNYGLGVKRYLQQCVTLLRIHRFDPDDVQFDDALVSSVIVWFRNAKPPAEHTIELSYGGTLTNPVTIRSISSDALRKVPKWTTLFEYDHATDISHMAVPLKKSKLLLADLFDIKRGIATGANQFFILSPQQVESYKLPADFLAPILPSPRYLSIDEIEADKYGNPILDHLRFLLSCNLPEAEVQASCPTLWKYLQTGVEQGVNERYLCRHRSPWYVQENRPPAPFLCTYMGRNTTRDNGNPFRFILNHSRATAPNVYLMLYPKPALAKIITGHPDLLKEIWYALKQISANNLIKLGRIYGGGLYKLEPKELANAGADTILELVPELSLESKQLSFGHRFF